MNAKRLLAAGSIAMAALITFPANADPGHGGARCAMGRHAMGMHSPMGAGLTERMADRLDLSKDQVTALRAIEDKYRPGLRDVRDRLRDSRDALAAPDAAKSPKLREIADARGKAIADMIVLRKQMRAEIHAVLTEEQQKKMHEMFHGGQGGWHRDHHGRWSPPGGKRGA